MHCNFSREKKLQRPALLDLPETVRAAALKVKPGSINPLSEEISSCAECIRTHFTAIEEMSTQNVFTEQGLETVIEMIRSCERLTTLEELNALTAVQNPANVLARSLKLVNKLARYSIIAKHLVRSARRFPIFQKIQVRQVKLRPAKVSTVGPDRFTSDAVQVLRSNPQWKKILSRLNSETYPDIETYLSRIPYKSFPVHAEIQLLVYSELHPRDLPPRIICSNKKACYLCDLFFKMHGKYLNPSTHGRLYEKWVLPYALQELPRQRKQRMQSTLQRLVQELERKISHQIRSTQKPYAQPNESLVLSSIVWSLSDQSAPRATSATSSNTITEAQPNFPLSPILEYPANEPSVDQSDASTQSATSFEQDDCETDVIELEKDVPVSKQVRPGVQELRIHTPKIHMLLSYEFPDTTKSPPKDDSSKVKSIEKPWTTVEWISVESYPGSARTTRVDLDEFEDGLEKTIELGQDTEERKLVLSRGKGEGIEIIFNKGLGSSV